MRELLSSDNFMVAATAIISISIGVFIRIASRNDRHRSMSRNDFAIGVDLMVAAIIILVTRPGGVSPWTLFFTFWSVWITSQLVRKRGWESEGHLTIFMGVVIPDLVGLTVLIFVVLFPISRFYEKRL